MPKSLLDNDLYKFSMQAAVLQHYPGARVRYELIFRTEAKFSLEMITELSNFIDAMGRLRFEETEIAYLANECHLPDYFCGFLRGFSLFPSQVKFVPAREDLSENGTLSHSGPKHLKIIITGLWYETILWEVPLMAAISEIYCREHGSAAIGVQTKTIQTALAMKEQGIEFIDFGTRRRFSFDTHKSVIEELITHARPALLGTSNLYFAKYKGLKPYGTQAHEWFMYHAAVYGYKKANEIALDKWVDTFKGKFDCALTDTYTTKHFAEHLSLMHAKLFSGFRFDSGDPKEQIERMEYAVLRLGAPSPKYYVVSDDINVTKATDLSNWYRYRKFAPKLLFGIGTFLTNGFGNKPLNMVIKLTKVCPADDNVWYPTVKLSDTDGKTLGPTNEVANCIHQITGERL
jgi:nicotinate phosphoribosyltransferase